MFLESKLEYRKTYLLSPMCGFVFIVEPPHDYQLWSEFDEGTCRGSLGCPMKGLTFAQVHKGEYSGVVTPPNPEVETHPPF